MRLPRLLHYMMLIMTLTGCGGGSPYVGLWQCEQDSTNGMEITRYENYFIVAKPSAGADFTREATFTDGSFAVGANHVGQQMALELVGDKLTCTNPPNFCQCDSGYKRVSSFASDLNSSTTKTEHSDEPLPTKQVGDVQNHFDDQQIIADDEAFNIELKNGGVIQVFEHFQNEEYGKRVFDWPKLTYYYLPHVAFAELDNGGIAEVREDQGSSYIFMRLVTRRVDRFELIEKFHENVNTKILPERVVTPAYQQVLLTLPQSNVQPLALTPESLSLDTSGTIDLAFLINPDEQEGDGSGVRLAREIVAAINRGTERPEVTIELQPVTNVEHLPAGTAPRPAISWAVSPGS
ncbi:MAG: hypothetical protein ACU84Q_17115 [Gammaproteobacteria bacterium]